MRAMLRRLFLMLAISAAMLAAQSGLNYEQLKQFLTSSIERGFSDKDVAKFYERANKDAKKGKDEKKDAVAPQKPKTNDNR